MTGFAELKDQINKTTDLQEKELLQQQLEAMHRAADEESKLHEDLIRGEWGVGMSEFKSCPVCQEQQAKIDELQKENAALVHVIKSRDIQPENEKHEYDELMNKLVDSGLQYKALQKRLVAGNLLIE